MSDYVIVELKGGDAGSADLAVCVDCDPGSVTRYEWRALVRADLVESFLSNAGAESVGEPAPWDGTAFGDGNGGTVEFVDGKIIGDGLNAVAL